MYLSNGPLSLLLYSKGGVAAAVGGGALLENEANGWATDFLHTVDAERVALKTSGVITAYAINDFYQNASTSPKMVYDVAGVLGWSPHNRVLQSQTFDAATWSKESSIITANATPAPDGTTTADKLVEDSSTGAHDINQVFATTTGTYSVYAKAAERPCMLFYDVATGNGDGFNLSTGATFVQAGIPTTGGATIQSVGNGWYRCSMPITASTSVSIYAHNGTHYSYAGNGSSGIYIWGAQANNGTVPTTYLPTTTAARYGLALDYDPVTHTAKGLLVEPAATNLHTHSQDISVLIWDGGTTAVNNQAGPDAALTADTYTEDTAAGTHSAYGAVTTVANADYTHSRYMKMGTRRYATLCLGDGTNGAYAVYDLQSGVVGSSAVRGTGVLNSASMQACPNGWYRCILSTKNPGTTTYFIVATANAASYTPADGHGRQSFTGTSATLFLGHAQVEAGTVATSPIPTAVATVTRAADNIYVTPASINYNATLASWRVEITLNVVAANARFIGVQAGGTAPIYVSNATGFGFWDGPWFGNKVVTSVLGTHKVAVALANGNRAGTADGLAVVTDATAGALSPISTRVGLGCDPVGVTGSDWMTGYIHKIVYVPRRKSNAELVTETT